LGVEGSVGGVGLARALYAVKAAPSRRTPYFFAFGSGRGICWVSLGLRVGGVLRWCTAKWRYVHEGIGVAGTYVRTHTCKSQKELGLFWVRARRAGDGWEPDGVWAEWARCMIADVIHVVNILYFILFPGHLAGGKEA